MPVDDAGRIITSLRIPECSFFHNRASRLCPWAARCSGHYQPRLMPILSSTPLTPWNLPPRLSSGVPGPSAIPGVNAALAATLLNAFSTYFFYCKAHLTYLLSVLLLLHTVVHLSPSGFSRYFSLGSTLSSPTAGEYCYYKKCICYSNQILAVPTNFFSSVNRVYVSLFFEGLGRFGLLFLNGIWSDSGLRPILYEYVMEKKYVRKDRYMLLYNMFICYGY